MQISLMYSESYLEEYRRKQKDKYNHCLDFVTKKINNNSKLKSTIVTFIALNLFMYNKVCAIDTLKRIDTGGAKILDVIQVIGYHACIIACAIEIIRTMLQGDAKSIGNIMAKYALSYGALFLMPWILDLIKGVFS